MNIRIGILFCVALSTAMGGCGIDFHIGNGGTITPPQKFELAANTANDVAALADDLNRIVQFSQGVEGLAPDLQEFFAAAGQGGSTTMFEKSQPGFAAADVDDECDLGAGGALPPDNICYISATTRRPEAGVESATWTFVLYFPNDSDGDIYGIDAYGARSFSDGSTSMAAIVDLEAENGTTAANLNRHNVELQENRYYRAGSRMVRQEGRIGINFRGTSDDDSAENRARVDDQADLVFYATLQQFFSDGSVIRVEYWPDRPVENNRDPEAGTVTRETTYENGPLRRALETFSFDGQSATGSRVLTYDDNSEERETYTINETEVQVSIRGRRGEAVEIAIDRRDGSYTKLVRPSADHPIERIEESGVIERSGTGRIDIDLVATTSFRNGDQETLEATVAVDVNGRAEVTYSKRNGDGVETGNLILVFGISSTSVAGNATLANGIEITVDGVVYADGYATLSVTADDPETEIDPDWYGDFRVYPDGSAEGEVVIDDITYVVTRSSDGVVSETVKE